jgi:hypothetical protein
MVPPKDFFYQYLQVRQDERLNDLTVFEEISKAKQSFAFEKFVPYYQTCEVNG